MSTLGLYFHVPFCAKKCSYCDFYSVCYTKTNAEQYVDAVLRNIKHYSDKSTVTDTVYFGGGTPSLLSSDAYAVILNEIKNCFCVSESAEITLEANPNTLTYEKLAELRRTGINRLSIGVQSLNDDELEFLGRKHSSERAVRAVTDAKKAGFENISCDLMIALPGQTKEKLLYSIEKMASMEIQHISAYILKIEEGTPFDCDEIRNSMPDEELSADLYLTMADELRRNGFEQYEISNFSKKGYESRHNCRYWKCLDYIGIGPSAHSCYKGKRFSAESDLQQFILSDTQKTTVTDENPCGFEEYAMLRLRLSEGLKLSDTGSHRDKIISKLQPLLNAGYISFMNDTVSLTAKGFLISNSIIEYLVF